MPKNIYFDRELTALEVRDPLLQACRQTAREFDLYAGFVQNQQSAFPYDQRRWPVSRRTRIGNGKHREWSVQFQHEPLGTNRITKAGSIVVRSLVDPSTMRYGGFEYGKYGSDEPTPTYRQIDLYTPSELGLWRPQDPDPELFEAAVAAIEAELAVPPTLFDAS
ncbi:MAG: hypothetical protein QG553_365 [Patescibacteria group bacterium]|nr:hypothetical protein [Patescibacteria group bacterium]